MKKIAYWSVVVILLLFSTFLYIANRDLHDRIETLCNSDNWINESENVILVVDTIFQRKYVVAVDTVLGNVEILGLRHSCEEIEN